MPWWFWVLLGAILLCAEILFVDTSFYMAILGVAALLLGGLNLVGIEAPLWGEWLAFAVLSAVLLVLFRRRLYARLRGAAGSKGPTVAPPLVGERGRALVAITAGARGRATLRGSTWDVVNKGAQTIPAGAGIRVTGTEGLVLQVEQEA